MCVEETFNALAKVWTGRQTHVDQQTQRLFKRKPALGGAFGLAGLTLAGCDVDAPSGILGKALRFGWPEGVTPEAHAMGNFWVWTWVAAWILGAIMWGLMLWCLFAYSAKRAEKQGKGEFPRQTGYNIGLELVLTVIPIIIVMGMFFFTVQTQDKVTALDKDPKVSVDVTAYQWNWKFGYGSIDGEFTPNGENYVGTDKERQEAVDRAGEFDDTTRGEEGTAHHGEAKGPIHGKSAADLSYLHFDKIETLGTSDEVPVLVIPANTPVEFDLASADVVHSFWVPEFLFKRDAFPHPERNKSERKFQVESVDEGAYVGRCAEMCGTYHAMMNFEVRAVSPELFKQYIEFRMDNPEASNGQALAAIGQKAAAETTKPFKTGRTDTRGVEEGSNAVELNG